MFYKNTSLTKKTFYGVTFGPGETKEVNGFINDVKMIRVNELPKEPPVRSKLKSTVPVKDKTKGVEPKTKSTEEEKVYGTDKNQ